MRDSKEFKSYAQKMRNKGQDFSQEMYEEMKRQRKQERVVREEQDPEFQEAFRKLNIDRLFAEFSARPMR